MKNSNDTIWNRTSGLPICSDICVTTVNVRNVFIIKYLDVLTVHSSTVTFDPSCISVVRQLKINFSQVACSVSTHRRKARVTNSKCLTFLGIGLCHTHLPAPQLEGWSYNELNPNCLYAETNRKGIFFIILDDICLKLLDQKSLL
jgi:hypothetical protein